MSHLPRFPAFRLPVKVDVCSGYRKSGVNHGLDFIHGRRGAKDVDHCCGGDSKRGRSEGEGEDRTEVILELGGLASFDGVVAGVMRSGSDLVEQEGT